MATELLPRYQPGDVIRSAERLADDLSRARFYVIDEVVGNDVDLIYRCAWDAVDMARATGSVGAIFEASGVRVHVTELIRRKAGG